MQRYINEKECEEYTGIAVSTLQTMRHIGYGPTYIKVGRKVLYDVHDLENYMQGCKTNQPTKGL